MPTPETVPFRLTRDMLAPMGVCGPNGVFKKSCETTLSILRRHQDVITTILEVLLYDPLYIWKVVPQVNDDNANNTSKLNINFVVLINLCRLQILFIRLSDSEYRIYFFRPKGNYRKFFIEWLIF